VAGEPTADYLVGIAPTATDRAPVLAFLRGIHAVLSVRGFLLAYLHFISRHFRDSGIHGRFQALSAKNPWKKYFLDTVSRLDADRRSRYRPSRVAAQF